MNHFAKTVVTTYFFLPYKSIFPGVFFASNAILLCGQLDLVCCSLRNARYTALLRCGIKHSVLAAAHGDIQGDELYNYIYNAAELQPSRYHYDQKMVEHFLLFVKYREIYFLCGIDGEFIQFIVTEP